MGDGRTVPVRRRAGSAARRGQDIGRILLAASRERRPRAALAMPPAGPGSEGDALLLRGAATLLGDATLSAGLDSSQQWSVPPPELLTPAFIRLLRRSLAVQDERALRLLAKVAGRQWDRYWFIGADVLDGAYGSAHFPYLDLVDFGVGRGHRGGVCGFSFSCEPKPAAVERLRAMHPDSVFVARGRASAARFETAVGRPCHVGPDLSWARLLIEYAETASPVPTPSGTTVGFNLSRQVGRAVGRRELVTVFTSLVRTSSERGRRVRFLAHDRRAPDADQDLLEEVAAAADVDCRSDVAATGSSIRDLIRNCHVIVSCRMHLAISSLAFGVPVVAVNYADKLEDLARDPDLAPFLRIVDPLGDDLEGAISRAVDELVDLGPVLAADLARAHDTKRQQLQVLAGALGGPPDSLSSEPPA